VTIDLFSIAVIAWVTVFGLATAALAYRRDRQIVAWAFFGAALGPVALILLWVAPPGRCATCRAAVQGWLTTCQWCGMDVRDATPGRARPSAAPVAAAGGALIVARPAGGGAGRPTISVAPVKRPTDPSTTTRGSRRPAAPKAKAKAPPAPNVKAAAAAAAPAVPSVVEVVASGVYMTGTVGLSAGSRYTIQMDGARLQVLGPSDRSPKTVAHERPLAGLEATGMEGRLILTAPGGRGGTALVFTAIDGDPEKVAQAVNRAVGAAAAVPA
jgi:hypothetical protein